MSLFFLLLVFAFSGCEQKDRRDAAESKGSSVDEPIRKSGVVVNEQRLLYHAAVKSGLKKEASVEKLVDEYREVLYGGLFLAVSYTHLTLPTKA